MEIIYYLLNISILSPKSCISRFEIFKSLRIEKCKIKIYLNLKKYFHSMKQNISGNICLVR